MKGYFLILERKRLTQTSETKLVNSENKSFFTIAMIKRELLRLKEGYPDLGSEK